MGQVSKTGTPKSGRPFERSAGEEHCGVKKRSNRLTKSSSSNTRGFALEKKREDHPAGKEGTLTGGDKES